tara:strand:- start:1405 stop:1719 length:315 start_codon:yes stop_codon:yes gene_type:complete
MSKVKHIEKATKYTGRNGEVLFTLHNVACRYYYTLKRSKTGSITYICYDGVGDNNEICNETVNPIDDAYSWFMLIRGEKLVEILYNRAHKMAQKALISANANGC